MIYVRRTRLNMKRVALVGAFAALAIGGVGFAAGAWWSESHELDRLRARLAELEHDREARPEMSDARTGPFARFNARSGLRSGDTILSIDGVPIEDAADLDVIARKYPANSEVQVVLQRGGEEFLACIRLGPRPPVVAEMRAR